MIDYSNDSFQAHPPSYFEVLHFTATSLPPRGVTDLTKPSKLKSILTVCLYLLKRQHKFHLPYSSQLSSTAVFLHLDGLD
jgi:hypothetical protein